MSCLEDTPAIIDCWCAVWGKVTADKVTVDIVSHFGTKKAEHQQKQIPLGDKDALVAVQLKDGRRTEPLAQAQVAVAANNQRTMGRAILAQQIDTMSDSSAIRDLAVARQLQQQNGLPFFRNGGAVGFMPIITTLPEGTNMFRDCRRLGRPAIRTSFSHTVVFHHS